MRVLTQPGNVAGEARFPNISRADPFGHCLGSLAIALGCSTRQLKTARGYLIGSFPPGISIIFSQGL